MLANLYCGFNDFTIKSCPFLSRIKMRKSDALTELSMIQKCKFRATSQKNLYTHIQSEHMSLINAYKKIKRWE